MKKFEQFYFDYSIGCIIAKVNFTDWIKMNADIRKGGDESCKKH